MWYRLQRLLCKLGILNELDYASPDSENERPHAYEPYKTFRPSRDNKRENDIPVGECCARCCGGKLHKVHQPPFPMDNTRTSSVGFNGGPHTFKAREDGYCEVCGGGQFYGLHVRVLGGLVDEVAQTIPARPLGDH